MCGIAGFIHQDWRGREAAARLHGMLDLIVHRGPDGEGTHFNDNLAMGMRRLSIIDLEAGGQPIWNEERSVAVVFNGEIYNYIELRRELQQAGHRFETSSDTEVLVHLYEQLGLEMFGRLRGMFAFALHDLRARRLVLARDHFGQKPLYYSAGPHWFAFASELKCLLTLPEVPRELSADGFFDYISWFSLPAPETHFKHIRKLTPGTFAVIPLDEAPEISTKTFWSYDLSRAPDLHDLEHAATELDTTLHETVGIHLRADVPIGVLLSSGLDSRCIAAYAQEHQHGALSTFSVGFGGADSELAGAAKTAQEIHSSHHQLELRPEDLSENIARLAWHLDEPVADAAAFAVWKVCELARGHVKVLLSGEGADEIFGGYDSRYSGMRQTIERSECIRRFAPLLPRPKSANGASRWERLCERAHISRGAEAMALRVEGLPGDVRAPRGLTSDQLQRFRTQKERLAKAAHRAQRDLLSELLVVDLEWQLAESLLQKADKMSMAASIELRTPFLDVEVAQLAARMHSDLKLPRGGPGKLVLRKCLAKRVPESLNRPKKGFPVPLRSWLCGPLREQVEAEVFSPNAAALTHLDRKLVRKAWDDFLAGKWEGAHVFYALWLYEVWFREVASQ